LLMDELAAEQRRASAAATRLEDLRSRALRLSNQFNLAWAIVALLGGAVAAFLVRRDHRLSRDVRRLERERAHELEQFAERVAHDIVSPLGSVSAGLHVLSRKLGDEAQAQGVARSVRASLGRVSAIVEELLRFARAGARPAPDERADLVRVIESVRDELLPAARAKGVALTLEPPPPVQVACAEAAILIVLQNLLRNAIKYIGDGPRKFVRAWAAVDSGMVRLTVADTGPGIPPGMERTVFEPYVRAEPSAEPGIGLGLATVKRIVESRAGKVGVSSDRERGATFWIELPVAAATDPALH
jgi:signal transduction histidine kinase